MKNNNSQSWIIQSKRSATDFKLKQILNYRYLIYCLVHRDITALYKQTILGPLWLLVQPLQYLRSFSGRCQKYRQTGFSGRYSICQVSSCGTTSPSA